MCIRDSISETWKSQRSELKGLWSGRLAQMEDVFAADISSLQSQQISERNGFQTQQAKLASCPIAIKGPGIQHNEWGQIQNQRKLRPSVLLLDLDQRYNKAMTTHRYGIAKELREQYQAQALVEWEQQTMKENAEYHSRSNKLEGEHKQQMKALWLRHRSALNELDIKADKELVMCDNYWRKQIQRLKEDTIEQRKQALSC
eukprot:TRINITY_DN3607_c0_g1_i11.p1 TRINITY_DN3607_c0_g1~~TRINITY_DN3607_c0_g1_i11.p1  ORF type:complete len:201 (+),score=40.39 TRINITY_DN3607_c0_g1_i11:178-780(+)